MAVKVRQIKLGQLVTLPVVYNMRISTIQLSHQGSQQQKDMMPTRGPLQVFEKKYFVLGRIVPYS